MPHRCSLELDFPGPRGYVQKLSRNVERGKKGVLLSIFIQVGAAWLAIIVFFRTIAATSQDLSIEAKEHSMAA